MSKRPKSHYKDPNRRSNWFKAEVVPARNLITARKTRYAEYFENGHSEHHSLVKALEIVSK